MAQKLHQADYDVVVVGGGCAGVAAAISAAKNGAKTLLLEAGSMIGGELITGLPVDGALNARGEWIVGGVLKEILDEHERLGGYIGPIKDWRLICYVCIDPEIMKIAVANVVRRHGVHVWMYSFAEDVVMDNGEVRGVVVLNKRQRTLVSAKVFIDCSGDGDVAMMAGAEAMISNDKGEFQPLTMLFRMSGVDSKRLLDFCVEAPENLAVGESEWMGAELTPRQCAEKLREQGHPAVFIKGNGPLIQNGIRNGDLKYETALIGIIPCRPNAAKCRSTPRASPISTRPIRSNCRRPSTAWSTKCGTAWRSCASACPVSRTRISRAWRIAWAFAKRGASSAITC